MRRARDSLRELPFLALSVLLPLAIVLLPSLIAAVNSFTDWNPGRESPFIGLANYEALMGSMTFWRALENQLSLLLGVPLLVAAPLFLAAVLQERVPAPGLFRLAFFVPFMVSPAVVGILFGLMLRPRGPLHELWRGVGLEALTRNWVVDATLVKPVLIILLCWWTLGTGLLIFSAGMTAIPRDLYDAADVDGASWWARFRHVTVPSLRHLIAMWAVIIVLIAFVGLFPWIFSLTKGGPNFASTTLDYDLYLRAFRFGSFGQAAAETVVLLALIGAVLLLAALLLRGVRRA